jgi:hypothetical protein
LIKVTQIILSIGAEVEGVDLTRPISPELVAEITTAPKTRYPLVGLLHIRKIIPNRLLDRIMIKTSGLKGADK